MISIFRKLFDRFRNLSPAVRQRTTIFLAALFSFLTISALFSIPAVNTLEWKMVDAWIQKTEKSVPNDKLVVIGLDENFIRDTGWPVDKGIYGEVIMYLNEMGAKVIAIDVLMDNKQMNCENDIDVFQMVLSQFHNVVLIYSPIEWELEPGITEPVIPVKYSVGKGRVPGKMITGVSLPYAELMAANPMVAHHNLAAEYPDGLKRRLPLLQSSAEHLFPALALITASLLNDSARINWDPFEQKVYLGDNFVPVDAGTNMFLNFDHKVPFYDMADIYLSYQKHIQGEKPDIGQEQLSGRAIFIGASAPLLGDNTVTPMSPMEGNKSSEVPKVSLHALAAATLMTNSGIEYTGRTGALLFSLGILILGAIFIRLLPISAVYGILVALGFAAYYLGQMLYSSGILVPMVEGLAAGVLFAFVGSVAIFFEKDLDKKFLFDSFKTYLSEELIDEMYDKRIAPKLGGSEGVRTAFFSDVQAFSTFSEAIGSPTRLVELLNEYLTDMTDILMAHAGTLDKYEGDAIIAFFGAPVEMPDHAEKACTASLDMQKRLGELRLKWQQEGDKWPQIVKNMRMRIGVNTGPMVTGNMGSKMRMNYTMMGDTVNLAARLESGAKQYGIYTLVSGDTADKLSDNIVKRKIDSIRVVGKTQPVDVYELLCFKEDMTGDIEKCLQLFAEGRKLYLEQNWQAAAEKFTASVELEPFHPEKIGIGSTCPSDVFLKRCAVYSENPPVAAGENWDGVFTASEK